MVQPETYLQRHIKELIRKRGGYAVKQHGSMLSEPGVPDILSCYKGWFLAIEAKDGNNTPSAAQGVHLRNIQKAGGITAVVWKIEEVSTILDILDEYNILEEPLQESILKEMKHFKINTGEEW